MTVYEVEIKVTASQLAHVICDHEPDEDEVRELLESGEYTDMGITTEELGEVVMIQELNSD